MTAPLLTMASPRQDRWFTWLSMAGVALASFLLYSRALGFAFFNDDPSGHFAWMESRSVVDFFASSAAYGYYRPVVFTILRGIEQLSGHQAGPFHLLLLLLHAANTALLWLLAFRLSGRRAYAWAAALIFAVVPFNYEAVAYVASLTHPLLLFWALLTLLFYQQGTRCRQAQQHTRAGLYFGAALVTLLLGLFTHENGLFIPLALAGLDWVERPPRDVRDGLRRPFVISFLPAVLFLVLWLAIPKNSSQGLQPAGHILSNLLPFLQTLVFPLLPLFDLDAGDGAWLLLLSAGTVAGLLVLAIRARALWLWLFALGWFVVSILPAILFLEPAYVYGSSRLSYLPAVGVALLWAIPLLTLAKQPVRSGWRAVAAALALLYLLLVTLPPLAFIRCQLDFYTEASRVVREMARLGQQAPGDRDLMLANTPFFFSSFAGRPDGCPNPYPWAPVGAIVMPPYALARDFILYNGGPDRQAQAVTVEAYNPAWRTTGTPLGVPELRSALEQQQVYVFDLLDGGFFDLSAAWQPGAAVAAPPLATFANQINLLAAEAGLAPAGGAIVTTLQWQTTQTLASSPVVFVHVYDEGGQLVAQHDGPPADGFVPFSWWRAGDVITDTHSALPETPFPPGTYTVAVGLYDPATGERYGASAVTGQAPDDAYVVGRLAVPGNAGTE